MFCLKRGSRRLENGVLGGQGHHPSLEGHGGYRVGTLWKLKGKIADFEGEYANRGEK